MSESGSEAVAKPINLSRLHENFAATKQSGKRAENIKVLTLEIIFKLTERCNIACDYCYYFDERNLDHADKPPVVREQTIAQLCDFILEAKRSNGLGIVKLDLHGGEPLLMKKKRFDAMCRQLSERLAEEVDLTLSLQTNGMLIDDEWIDLFIQYNVFVGVSLDGGPEVNDRHRIDHQGRGTYKQTVAGLRKLQARMPDKIGLISVLGSEDNALDSFRHLVDELGITQIHYSVEDREHGRADAAYRAGIARNMRVIYREWARRNDPALGIRFVSRAVGGLLGGKELFKRRAEQRPGYMAITVRSDGTLGPDDDLRNVMPDAFKLGMNIKTHRLQDYADHPRIAEYLRVTSKPSTQCADCCWLHVCESGFFLSGHMQRFDEARQFDNRSVHCAGIQELLTEICKDALDRGHSFEKIREVLHEPLAA